jgi:hypothetical protein
MRRRLVVAPGALALVIAAGACSRGESPAPAAAEPARATGAASVYPILIPGGEEVVAGHVRFRLVGARIDAHELGSAGEPTTLALRMSLRATELDSRDTRVTGEDVRLLAGGRAHPAQVAPNVAIWASQSVDLDELVFVVPAPLATASLQIGTSDGGSALLALRLPR